MIVWDAPQRTELEAMCERLNVDVLDLVKLMSHESGCNPAAICWHTEHDEHGEPIEHTDPETGEKFTRYPVAVGLIQFTPAWLGIPGGAAARKRLLAIAAMPVLAQLPLVERYFGPHARAGLLAGGLPALYTACFLPAQLAHVGNLDYHLCGEAGPLAWAWRSNLAFDPPDPKTGKRKGFISPRDLVREAERAYSMCAMAQQIIVAFTNGTIYVEPAEEPMTKPHNDPGDT